MKPATDLEDAIVIFDPVDPLTTAGEIAAYYVDRGSISRGMMRTRLLAGKRAGKPVKMLFTGHKGTGKSTEVNKLCLELGNEFFIVKVAFGKRPDVTYIDILVKAAMALFKAASNEEYIARAPAQIAQGLWEDIAGFIEKKLFGAMPRTSRLIPDGKFSAKVNAYGVEFEGKYESEPESRKQIRQVSEQQLSEIRDKINLIANEVRVHYGLPVLFLFEDTDKIDLAQAKENFYGRGPTLTDFRASAIYLMPIGLRYSPQFATIKQFFGDDFYWLPNIKIRYRNGDECAEGVQLLEKIISTRLDQTLMADDARQEIIRSSGGLIRSLVTLARDSAVIALGRNSARIELHDVQRAVKRLRGDFIAMLREEHYPVLLQRHKDKKLSSDPEIQELLESLALLEYDNDIYWCDVHPVVLPIVVERTTPAPDAT